jgi:hypothetical protein
MDSELRAGTLLAVVNGEEHFVCDCLLEISSDLTNINVAVVHPQEVKLEGITGTLQEMVVAVSGFKIRMSVSGLPMLLYKHTDFTVHFNA